MRVSFQAERKPPNIVARLPQTMHSPASCTCPEERDASERQLSAVRHLSGAPAKQVAISLVSIGARRCGARRKRHRLAMLAAGVRVLRLAREAVDITCRYKILESSNVR